MIHKPGCLCAECEDKRDAALGRKLRALLMGDDDSKDRPVEVAYADATECMNTRIGYKKAHSRLYELVGALRVALHEDGQ